MTQPDWPARVALVIAGEVRRYREKKGLSAQQLADACAALGLPIQRSVLANFENGRRNTISVAELIVLAKALDVPPALLVFPLGHQPALEVLPDQERPTWMGVKWFTGDEPFPRADGISGMITLVGTPDDNQAWADGARPVVFHRDHDRLVRNWRWEFERIPIIREAVANAATDDVRVEYEQRLRQAQEQVAQLERELAQHRQNMRRHGVAPPTLPDELRRLDGREQRDDQEA